MGSRGLNTLILDNAKIDQIYVIEVDSHEYVVHATVRRTNATIIDDVNKKTDGQRGMATSARLLLLIRNILIYMNI